MKTKALVLVPSFCFVASTALAFQVNETKTEVPKEAIRYATKALSGVESEIESVQSQIKKLKSNIGKTGDERKKNRETMQSLTEKVKNLKNGKLLPIPKMSIGRVETGDVGELVEFDQPSTTPSRLSGGVKPSSFTPSFKVVAIRKNDLICRSGDNDNYIFRGLDNSKYKVNEIVVFSDVVFVARPFENDYDEIRHSVFEVFEFEKYLDAAVETVKEESKKKSKQ